MYRCPSWGWVRFGNKVMTMTRTYHVCNIRANYFTLQLLQVGDFESTLFQSCIKTTAVNFQENIFIPQRYVIRVQCPPKFDPGVDLHTALFERRHTPPPHATYPDTRPLRNEEGGTKSVRYQPAPREKLRLSDCRKTLGEIDGASLFLSMYDIDDRSVGLRVAPCSS